MVETIQQTHTHTHNIISHSNNSQIMVEHPAAKSMMEIARTQDEEVGDGTTSVVILAGELMTVALPFLEQQVCGILRSTITYFGAFFDHFSVS